MLDAEQGWRGAELQHNHLQPLCSTQQREPHRTAPQSPQHPKGGQRGQPRDPNPKPTAFTVRRVPTEPGADVFLSPLFKYRAGATREVKFYNFSLFFFFFCLKRWEGKKKKIKGRRLEKFNRGRKSLLKKKKDAGRSVSGDGAEILKKGKSLRRQRRRMERGEGKELLIEKREIQMKYPISSKEKEERQTMAATRRREIAKAPSFFSLPM